MELLRRFLIIFASCYGFVKFFIFTWYSSALIWIISEDECVEELCVIETLEFGFITFFLVPATMILVLGSVTVSLHNFQPLLLA